MLPPDNVGLPQTFNLYKIIPVNATSWGAVKGDMSVESSLWQKVKERGCPHSRRLTCPSLLPRCSLHCLPAPFALALPPSHGHQEKVDQEQVPRCLVARQWCCFLRLGGSDCSVTLSVTLLSRYTVGISLGPCCVSAELGRNPRRATHVLKTVQCNERLLVTLVLLVWPPLKGAWETGKIAVSSSSLFPSTSIRPPSDMWHHVFWFQRSLPRWEAVTFTEHHTKCFTEEKSTQGGFSCAFSLCSVRILFVMPVKYYINHALIFSSLWLSHHDRICLRRINCFQTQTYGRRISLYFHSTSCGWCSAFETRRVFPPPCSPYNRWYIM